MQYTYIAPRLPGLRRWRDLHRRFPGNSVLRVLEYEALAEHDLDGEVLDIGGGRKAKYAQYLPDRAVLHSVNIDPSIAPTYLVEPGERFPIEDGRYAKAICLNTLEHVYDTAFMIEEIHRVLEPGGTVHITVPFIFRIHGHPDDFSRHTPSWWRETLMRAGFESTTLLPLIWGRYTTAGMIGSYRGPVRLQRAWDHLRDILYAAIVFRKHDTYAGRRGHHICAVSPGWFISATKAAASASVSSASGHSS